MKTDINNIGNGEELKKTATILSNIAQNFNIYIGTTLQLAETQTDPINLSVNDMAVSRTVKEVLDTLCLFKQIRSENFDEYQFSINETDEKALNIDSILFSCRDHLRAAHNSGSFFEKRDMMLTLVFLRFIGEKYEDGIEVLRKTLIEQGLDPDDENIRAEFFEDATFADGTYNLSMEARWSTIINMPAPKLNVALDTALTRLEEEDPQLKGCFIKGTFITGNLASNDIKKIVDDVNKISHKAFGVEKDLIGYVYEYFLKEFAVNATKEEGEFYTSHDVVQLIAAMIEPFEGTLYAPVCGFHVIIMTVANSLRKSRVPDALPMFGTREYMSLSIL